jgi:hypothetical protein
MIWKETKLAKPSLDVDYLIEMHKSVFCDELLNYSARDLLAGGVLCEDVDSQPLPEHNKHCIKHWLYNAHPYKEIIWKKYPVKGFMYLLDNPDTKKMEIIHYEPTDKEREDSIS